jgi:glycerophosphoryl diester phosphodiesterase
MKNNIITFVLIFLVMTLSSKTIGQVAFPKFDFEAHRGGRGLMPENTIASMLHAMDFAKTTTLEMDLSITKDLKVVVSHDPQLNKVITSNPDGSSLLQDAKEYIIYQMDYDEVSKYDVGVRPNPRFPKKNNIAANIPLFANLIDSVEKKSKQINKSFWYNIEIKSIDGKDGIEHPDPNTFVSLVMEIVKEKQIENRVVIQSFDIRPLKVLHEKYPTMRLSYLVEGKNSKDVESRINELGFIPFIYSSEYNFLDKEMIQYCHSKNMKVVPWTVNTTTEIKQLIDLNVNGYITDYPNLF